MAKKKKGDCPPAGAPAWMATYGDMVTLLLCFFVLLFSMSSVDIAKFKAAMSSFADQIDVMPGGETLTDGELLNNGISQLNDIQITFTGGMPINTNERDIDDTDPLDSENDKDDEKDPEQENVDLEDLENYEVTGQIAKDIQEIINEENLDTSVSIALTSNYVKFTLTGDFLFDSGRAELKPEAANAIKLIIEQVQKGNYEGFDEYDVEIEGHTDNRPINSQQFPNNWILSSYRAYAVLEELTENYNFSPERVAATGYGEFRPIADNNTIEGQALNRRVEIKVVVNTEEVTLEEISVDELESNTEIDNESNDTNESEINTENIGN